MKALRPLCESLLIHGIVLALLIPVTRGLSAPVTRSTPGMLRIDFALSGADEGGGSLLAGGAQASSEPAPMATAAVPQAKKTAAPSVPAPGAARPVPVARVEPQVSKPVRAVSKPALKAVAPESVVPPVPEPEPTVARVVAAAPSAATRPTPAPQPPEPAAVTPPELAAADPSPRHQQGADGPAQETSLAGESSAMPASGSERGEGLSSSSAAESAAGINGTAPGVGSAAIEGYRQANFGAIRTRIHNQLYYPGLARRRGWSGRIEVVFRVATDGSLIDAQVVLSSGYPLLDKQALKAIKKAAPFTPPPQIAQFRMPVVFELN